MKPDLIMATTKEDVKLYCEKFNLSYVEAPNAPLDDVEEWPDTVCAGFQDDPAYMGTIIFLQSSGQCFVTTAFCDSHNLEDIHTPVPAEHVRRAVMTGKRLHAALGEDYD